MYSFARILSTVRCTRTSNTTLASLRGTFIQHTVSHRVFRRTYASEAPTISPTPSPPPTKSEIFKKLTASPAVMSATMKMIEVMEHRGLNPAEMPTPDEWAQMIKDEEVQSAIRAVGTACDEAGVPMNAQVLAELTGGYSGDEKE